jgi:uncharacterized surface protein with fasciclin (FAS1) repeats
VIRDQCWRRIVGRRSTAKTLNVRTMCRASLVDCKPSFIVSEIEAVFVTIRKCAAHNAYFTPSAVYELRWAENSRWLFGEDLFMSQSTTTLAGEPIGSHHTAPVKNIVDTMTDANQFTTLAAGLKAAELSNRLSNNGPFIVFAPTDKTFERLPKGAVDALLKDSAKLKAVLNYHMIADRVTVRDMKSGDVVTLQGSALTVAVSSSDVQVNGAHVKRADLVAANGVIHAIDALIMPKNWQVLAAAA